MVPIFASLRRAKRGGGRWDGSIEVLRVRVNVRRRRPAARRPWRGPPI